MFQKPFASVKIDGVRYALPSAAATIDALTVEESFQTYVADGTAYDWTVALKNNENRATGMITELYGLDYTLPLGAEEALTMQTLRGDDCSEKSFWPEVFDLRVGDTVVREPSGGRSSNTTAFPYFDFTWPGGSLIFGIGWSGQWTMTVTRSETGVHITAGQTDCHMVLQPGEHIRTVRILLMQAACDARTIRQRFVEVQRRFVSPLTIHGRDFESPIAVQCFDRYFWQSDDEAAQGRAPYFETEAAQVKLCERAGLCKEFDTHWVDACWFKDTFRSGVGNYSTPSVGFPNGLKPISEAAHRNGMRLIVWFEPMRAQPGTEVCAVFANEPRKLLWNPETNSYLVHLGDDKVWQWMTEKIVEIMEKNGIDAYRQDFNINPRPSLQTIEAPDRIGYEQMRFVEGLYKLWDALRAHFPGLFIDNCSSGGRNLDVETNARSISLWHSDTSCFAERNGIPMSLWHQNENLSLSQYLPLHQSSSFTPDAYSVRSAMTGGISCEFEMLDDTFDSETICRALHEVRTLGRYWKGDYTPLTAPSLSENDYCAYTLHLPETDEALLVALRRKNAPETYTAKIDGLCAEQTYRLTFSDEQYQMTERTATGADLAEGLLLTLPQAPGSVVVQIAPMN